MFYNYHEDYQYDSCISKGICSINPRTSSLREVLVMYLKQLAFYTLKLKHLGLKNDSTEGIILNTLSGLMSNLEIGNQQFYKTLMSLKSIIIESIKTYKDVCKSKNIQIKSMPSVIRLNKQLNISELIKLGEKEFSEKIKLVSQEKRNLFEVIFMVLKSICINLVEIQSYGLDDQTAYLEILYLLNTLNYPNSSAYIYKKKILKAIEIDFCLAKRLHRIKTERFGSQTEGEVSYSTRPNKCILVAGTNIQELKNVLDYTKDKSIDVYTHGDMIEVYTYPKFQEYKHLRGQFGKGIENCLLDFATFPGAILIAKHSLETIEYLYRGRLFTTDNFVPQGVIKIKDNDFTPLVNSALSARGFKKGQIHPSVKLGCTEEEFDTKMDEILSKMKSLKNIVIFPTEMNTVLQKEYFESFISKTDDETLVISLSNIPCDKKVIVINSAPDICMLYKIFDRISSSAEENNVAISVFISKCDKHTISNILNLKKIGVNNVFLSKCTPIMLNPTLTETLKTEFDIRPTTKPAEDLRLL